MAISIPPGSTGPQPIVFYNAPFTDNVGGYTQAGNVYLPDNKISLELETVTAVLVNEWSGGVKNSAYEQKCPNSFKKVEDAVLKLGDGAIATRAWNCCGSPTTPATRTRSRS